MNINQAFQNIKNTRNNFKIRIKRIYLSASVASTRSIFIFFKNQDLIFQFDYHI